MCHLFGLDAQPSRRGGAPRPPALSAPGRTAQAGDGRAAWSPAFVRAGRSVATPACPCGTQSVVVRRAVGISTGPEGNAMIALGMEMMAALPQTVSSTSFMNTREIVPVVP